MGQEQYWQEGGMMNRTPTSNDRSDGDEFLGIDNIPMYTMDDTTMTAI